MVALRLAQNTDSCSQSVTDLITKPSSTILGNVQTSWSATSSALPWPSLIPRQRYDRVEPQLVILSKNCWWNFTLVMLQFFWNANQSSWLAPKNLRLWQGELPAGKQELLSQQQLNYGVTIAATVFCWLLQPLSLCRFHNLLELRSQQLSLCAKRRQQCWWLCNM